MKFQLLSHPTTSEKKPLSNDIPQIKYIVYTAGSVLAFLEFVYIPIRRWFFMRQFEPIWSSLRDMQTLMEERQYIGRFDAAVFLGNVKDVKAALRLNPELATKQLYYDGTPGTPIEIASVLGHTNVVTLLAGCPNISINKRYKGKQKKSILILNAELHHNEQRLKAQWTGIRRFLPFKKESIFDILVRMGIDVDLQDKGGNSALIAACTCNHVHIASKLLDLGADPMLENRRGIDARYIIMKNPELRRKLTPKLRENFSEPDRAVSSNILPCSGQVSPVVVFASDELHGSVDEWNSCKSSIHDDVSVVSSSGSTNAIHLER
jgi:hypothetical protein